MAIGTAFAFKALGAGVSILEQFGQAMEFQRQNQVEINILKNNTEMVLLGEKQMKRDIDIRAGIMSGDLVASAGTRGVTSDSASIVNAAATVIARSKIDKLRLGIQAQNQIALNKMKEQELQRQNQMAISKAAVGAGTSILKAFSPF